MQTFTSRDVQQQFGRVMDLARHEDITITKYGRPFVVMMGIEEAQAVQRQRAGSRLATFLRTLPISPAAEALTDEDINALVHELR
jgi:antitoxin Phd